VGLSSRVTTANPEGVVEGPERERGLTSDVEGLPVDLPEGHNGGVEAVEEGRIEIVRAQGGGKGGEGSRAWEGDLQAIRETPRRARVVEKPSQTLDADARRGDIIAKTHLVSHVQINIGVKDRSREEPEGQAKWGVRSQGDDGRRDISPAGEEAPPVIGPVEVRLGGEVEDKGGIGAKGSRVELHHVDEAKEAAVDVGG
jgi:hypothetical protein